MPNDKKALVVLGLLLSSVISLALIQNCDDYWIECLQKWQTMIVGIIATFVAAITAFIIYNGSAEQRHQYIKSIQRKELSARAQLPIALAELNAYLAQVAGYLVGKVNATQPEKPNDAVDALKFAIVHIDQDAANRVFELLMFYQIHNSRLTNMSDIDRGNLAGNPKLQERLIDASRLSALVTSLYDYGRYRSEAGPTSPLSSEDVFNGLRSIVSTEYYYSNEAIFDDVVQRVSRVEDWHVTDRNWND